MEVQYFHTQAYFPGLSQRERERERERERGIGKWEKGGDGEGERDRKKYIEIERPGIDKYIDQWIDR